MSRTLVRIEALTAKLKDAEDERDHACNAADREETRAEAAEVREQDAYERGFKAALEKAAKVADNMSEIREGEQTSFIDDTAEHEADFGHNIAEAIRAALSAIKEGDNNETE